MSITTLSRKTKTMYNRMSANAENGFSVNGTQRLHNYVGQSVINVDTNCLNSDTCGDLISSSKSIINNSVLNSKGMMSIKLSKGSCKTVKSGIKSSSEYVADIVKTCRINASLPIIPLFTSTGGVRQTSSTSFVYFTSGIGSVETRGYNTDFKLNFINETKNKLNPNYSKQIQYFELGIRILGPGTDPNEPLDFDKQITTDDNTDGIYSSIFEYGTDIHIMDEVGDVVSKSWLIENKVSIRMDGPLDTGATSILVTGLSGTGYVAYIYGKFIESSFVDYAIITDISIDIKYKTLAILEVGGIKIDEDIEYTSANTQFGQISTLIGVSMDDTVETVPSISIFYYTSEGRFITPTPYILDNGFRLVFKLNEYIVLPHDGGQVAFMEYFEVGVKIDNIEYGLIFENGKLTSPRYYETAEYQINIFGPLIRNSGECSITITSAQNNSDKNVDVYGIFKSDFQINRDVVTLMSPSTYVSTKYHTVGSSLQSRGSHNVEYVNIYHTTGEGSFESKKPYSYDFGISFTLDSIESSVTSDDMSLFKLFEFGVRIVDRESTDEIDDTIYGIKYNIIDETIELYDSTMAELVSYTKMDNIQ